MLESPDVFLRFQKAKWTAASTDDIATLLVHLKDHTLYGRFDLAYVAAVALGGIRSKDPVVLDALMHTVRTNSPGSHQAIEALVLTGPRHVPLAFWVDSLRSTDDVIVRSSAVALGRMGPEAAPAVDALITAGFANVSATIPQNFMWCTEALVKIAPTDARCLHFFDRLARQVCVVTGIKSLHAAMTPQATALLAGIFVGNQHVGSEFFKGLYGHRLKKVLDEVEATHPELHFHCRDCGKAMGRGASRACCGFSYH